MKHITIRIYRDNTIQQQQPLRAIKPDHQIICGDTTYLIFTAKDMSLQRVHDLLWEHHIEVKQPTRQLSLWGE